MCVLTVGHLDQLVNYMLWCWLVRVAHAEINNVFTTVTSGHLQLVYDAEYVGRQAIYSRKIFVQVSKTR